MRAPSEMVLEPGKILKVIRPLYGMPESPMHWFATCLKYHRSNLGMSHLPLDPCFLYMNDEEKVNGLLGLPVDDTLYGGNLGFSNEEMEKSAKFPSKGRTTISSKPTKYNGVHISTDGEKVSECLRKNSQFTEALYKSESAEAMSILRKCLKTMLSAPSIYGLKFVPLQSENIEVVCVDAAFATNKDESSGLGILAMLRDSKTGMVNIVHFSSNKSKRVCKSVLAAELHAFVDGYDLGYSLKNSIQTITGTNNVPLVMYNDSKCLYGLCVSLAGTTEKRLHIDLALIREAYEKRDISSII